MGARVTLTRGEPFSSTFLNLRGGLNNSNTDEEIRPDEISDGENYHPDLFNAGMLVKRRGVAKQLANQQTEVITSIYQGVVDDYFTTSTTIKRFTSNTAITSGLTSSTNPDWASLGGMDIYVNGADAPRKVTAGPTGAALGGTPPTAKYVQDFHNYVFMAGHSTGILRWSDVGTTETWTAANSLTITNNKDDDIIGLATFRGLLMVMCERSFHHIYDAYSNVMAIAYSNFEEGCTSHRSIVSCPYGLFWWSKAGLAKSADGFAIDYPTLRKIPQTLNGLNRAQYGLVHGVWNPRNKRLEYYCHEGTSTTVNIAIFYYPEEDSCWIMRGDGVEMGASGMAILLGVADIYLGSAIATGYLYKQTGTIDDGAAISGFLATKRDATPSGQLAEKRADILTFHGFNTGASTVSYQVYLNNDTSPRNEYTIPILRPGFLLGTDTLGIGSLGIGYKAFDKHIGYGRIFHKLKHRISESAENEIRIRGFSIRGHLTSA